MKMTQAELDKKLDAHEAWRRGEGGECLVLLNEDLNGLSFTGRNLRGAILAGCKVRGCDFSNTKGLDLAGVRF